MYRLILLISFVLLQQLTTAATGFKLGLMAGANTSINQYYTFGSVTNIDSKLGYNANVFGRIQLKGLLIQPEVGYLNNRVGVSFLEQGNTVEANFSLGQLYSALLFGIKFSKIRIGVGPTATMNTNQNFDELTSTQSFMKQVDEGKINLGAMINLGLDLSKRWSIDARFHRTFTTSDFQAIVENNTTSFKGNTGVLSLNLGFSLFGKP